MELIELEDLECVAETPLSIAVRPLGLENGAEDHWVPKSVIDSISSEICKLGDKGTLVIAEWFAIKEGLV